MRSKSILVLAIACAMTVANVASAELIRGIDIDFVTIGNAGNTADTGGTPGSGAVSYEYRIGKYEVTNAQWNDVGSLSGGLPTGNPYNAYNAGATYTGNQQPTNNVSWYEAVQFCNYLTSGDKSQGVYQFNGSNNNPGDFLGINRSAAEATYGTIYFLPTEDEWYKAAYYKPSGSGYSLYANGTNTAPAHDSASNYYRGGHGPYSTPWNVGTGTEEQNGTFDMMGNLREWNETLYEGWMRGFEGGSFLHTDAVLASTYQTYYNPEYQDYRVGFRVASVPEPTTLLLLGVGAVVLRRNR